MSTSFSQAALDRIAECASSEAVTPEGSPVAALLERYFKRDPEHGLADKDFPDAFDAELSEIFGDSDGIVGLEAANEFYRFAGLLELAIRVGYVDLSAWDEAGELQRALRHFADREIASEKPTDLTLISALIARLERCEWHVATRDNDVFFAFASLLHLTSCVRDDRETLQFFHESTRTWSVAEEVGDDLPFLLTPRHFAEAVAFRTVGGSKSKTVTQGLAALRYLQWFAEILDCVKHTESLAEDFVRQARWSHHTPAVRRRVDIWADRMSEWADAGVDREGDEAWKQFKQTVLFSIERYVDRVRPPAAQETRAEPHFMRPIEIPSIEGMLAEGRIGAARKLAREHAEWCSQQVAGAEGDDLSDGARELILACEKLAEVGAVDIAAVIIAPFLDKLDIRDLEAAQRLLAASRSQRWPSPPPATESVSAQEAPFSGAEPKQHSLGGEEQASFTAS